MAKFVDSHLAWSIWLYTKSIKPALTYAVGIDMVAQNAAYAKASQDRNIEMFLQATSV